MDYTQHKMNPLLAFFLNQIQDAPAGMVGLITHELRYHQFGVACEILDHRYILLHPDQLMHKAQGIEFALVLVDNRVFLGAERHELLQTRMRAPGSGPQQIKWIEIP